MALHLNLGVSLLYASGTLGTVSEVEWRHPYSCGFLSQHGETVGLAERNKHLPCAGPRAEPKPSPWLLVTMQRGRCRPEPQRVRTALQVIEPAGKSRGLSPGFPASTSCPPGHCLTPTPVALLSHHGSLSHPGGTEAQQCPKTKAEEMPFLVLIPMPSMAGVVGKCVPRRYPVCPSSQVAPARSLALSQVLYIHHFIYY